MTANVWTLPDLTLSWAELPLTYYSKLRFLPLSVDTLLPSTNIPLSPLSSEVRGIPGDVSPVSPHPPLGQDRRNEKRTKTPLPFPQLM